MCKWIPVVPQEKKIMKFNSPACHLGWSSLKSRPFCKEEGDTFRSRSSPDEDFCKNDSNLQINGNDDDDVKGA